MPSYLELQSKCSVEDIYNLIEIADAKIEMDSEYNRLRAQQEAARP